jgi:hypothetical protein
MEILNRMLMGSAVVSVFQSNLHSSSRAFSDPWSIKPQTSAAQCRFHAIICFRVLDLHNKKYFSFA